MLMSCAQNNPSSPANSNSASVELTISTTAFSKAIAQPDAQILDVRTAGEYQSGHIANALQANWLDPKEFKNRTQHLDKSKTIYIYCQSGGRSASAQTALIQAGFTLVNLE
jgi:rhodanese-related sulfurtransferase